AFFQEKKQKNGTKKLQIKQYYGRRIRLPIPNYMQTSLHTNTKKQQKNLGEEVRNPSSTKGLFKFH
ncbi:MAG: hypothetical protein Q4G12_10755, partial [Bacteroidales bacterium]|nr:hypothetical protein [Bacteroidales bacterium]